MIFALRNNRQLFLATTSALLALSACSGKIPAQVAATSSAGTAAAAGTVGVSAGADRTATGADAGAGTGANSSAGAGVGANVAVTTTLTPLPTASAPISVPTSLPSLVPSALPTALPSALPTAIPSAKASVAVVVQPDAGGGNGGFVAPPLPTPRPTANTFASAGASAAQDFITFHNPADTATVVAINRTLKVTFSQAMDQATFINANFKVTNGAGPDLGGTVAYDAPTKTATYTAPVANYPLNTLLTATLTTGITSGTVPLVAPYSWKFTTGTAVSVPTVLLGADIAPMVVFGNTGVTNTGNTTIVGDLGCITPSFTGSSTVTFNPGVIHSNDTAAQAATLQMGTAYTDAQSRAGGNLPSGDLALISPIAPGLYPTNVAFTLAGGKTVLIDGHGDADAVWIFKTSGKLLLAPGAQVILSGRAQAKNIFWTTADDTVLDTTSVLVGTVLSKFQVNFLTGASLVGRALAQTQVTLQANTITKP
jgi:hypothetical protein